MNIIEEWTEVVRGGTSADVPQTEENRHQTCLFKQEFTTLFRGDFIEKESLKKRFASKN